MLRNSIFSALFIDNSNYILNFANENRIKQVKNLQNRETDNSEAEGPTLTKQRNKTGADTTPAPFKNRKRDNKQNTNRGATLTTKRKSYEYKTRKNPRTDLRRVWPCWCCVPVVRRTPPRRFRSLMASGPRTRLRGIYL